MVKKILIILSFMAAAVGAVREPPLQGLVFADVPLSQQADPCPPECVTDSMEIVTWYPSPYNEYEELRLYPISDSNSQCNSDTRGLMYYDSDEDKVKLCKGPAGLNNWQDLGGAYWDVSSSNANDIYYTQSGNVGIGTDSPSAKLEVTGTIQTQGFKMPTGAQAGYVLTVDASGNASWQPPAGGSSFSNIVPYNTAGTYSFAVPSGVTQVMVEVFGSGGGGDGDWHCTGGDLCGGMGRGGGGAGGGGIWKGHF